MKCSVCEGTSFTEDCGIRTCDFCGTEDRNFVALESQEAFGYLDRSQITRIKKEKIVVDQEEEATLGRSETYNVILHGWTKALRSLGASRRFEKIIMELWIWYLQRTGTAFCQEEDSQKPKGSKKLDMDTLQKKKYSYFPATAKIQGKPVPQAITVKVFESTKMVFLPDNLTFAKLLSIVYLALVLAEEPILLMDLVRWCREGHIPYFSVQNLLPPGVKTELVKGTHVINLVQIRDHSSYLAMFLNILYLPIPDYKTIVDRVVNTLRLPVVVGDLALRIMKKRLDNSKIPRMLPLGIEFHAIAAVIRILNDYLGLDDCSEYYLSTAIREITGIIGEKKGITPFFCWEAWQKYINKLIWFCGEVDHITNMHSRHSEFCNLGEGGGFFRFAWTEGIWRLGYLNPTKTLGISATQCQSYAEEVLNAQNSSLEAQFDHPFEYKPTKVPIRDIVEQFVNSPGKEDESGLLMKIGRELLDTNFSDHLFELPAMDVLQEEIKKCGSDLRLSTRVPVRQLTRENRQLLYLPQPIKRASKTIDFTTHHGKLKNLPSRSFEWLLAISYIFFEVDGYELMQVVKLYNHLYKKL